MTEHGELSKVFLYWSVACRDDHIDVDVKTMQYNSETDEWEEYGKDTVTIRMSDLEELGIV